jgi:hypothetical protein
MGTEKTEKKLPISYFYKVIDHITVFKSSKWWEAIVVFEYGGRRDWSVPVAEESRKLEEETQVQHQKPRRME